MIWHFGPFANPAGCGLSLLLAWSFLVSVPLAHARDGGTPEGPPRIVRQVDHILLVSPAAPRIFEALTGDLRLPVAWPFAAYGGFSSGGVALGNVNLEIIAAPPDATGEETHRFSGLALEPEPLSAAVAELDARRLAHGETVPTGARWLAKITKPRWSTVSLPEVSAPGFGVFLCEYGHDVAARRRKLREELDSRSGGPLGVLGVNAIVYGTRRPAELEDRWRRLLVPEVTGTNGVWRIGNGPMLRLVAANHDALSEFVIGVRSLDEARRFLIENGWLGEGEPGSLTVGGPVFRDVRLRLMEGAATAP